jgi:type IV secretion system protein VirB4
VYQYLFKRRIDPLIAGPCDHPIADAAIRHRVEFLNDRRSELYDIALYLVLVYEGLGRHRRTSTRLQGLWREPRRALREWLSIETALTLFGTELDRAVARLYQKAAAFEVLLADSIRPRRLDKTEAFRFFRRLVNYVPHKAAGPSLKYDTHLDYFVADSSIDCHRSHLDVDGVHVKVLTMKEPPSATFAHVLEDLYTVPGEFIACLEWRRLATDRIRRDIHSRRRHFFNKRVSLINYVAAPDNRPDEMLVDLPSDTIVEQLGQALIEVDVHGHFFGECSLSLVLFDREPRAVERTAAEAMKVFAAHDGALFEETYNLLNAWLAVIPGNGAHNLRRLAVLETNAADLSFLFTLDTGHPQCPHLRGDALAIFETRHHTPYHLALHVQDVGHGLITGQTGSGKTLVLRFMLTHAQKYGPIIVVFDLGHSFRQLATVFDGSYLEFALRQSGVTINPFALEPAPEHLHFLHGFTRVLVEGSDGYRLSELEDRELYEAIENLYVLDRAQRRLFTLANLLPRALSQRLGKWIEGGRYGDLFDHVEDTLSVQPFQVFDFEAMRAYPALIEPLLFYVLHRVSSQIHDTEGDRLKLCVMDEAWRFIQHPTLRAYVEEALKTWRKRNGAMWLATQSIEDFASADLLRTVIEACPTKLLLANPALDRARYADLFQLNPVELDLLTTLLPRRQMLLKRPDLSKVLALNLDPQSSWLYTNTPVDHQRLASLSQRYDVEASPDHVAASA